MPQRYRDWKEEAAWELKAAAMQAEGAGFDGDEPVAVTVYFDEDGATVSVTNTGARRPKGTKGDIDNLAKSVLDALQDSGLIPDDKTVHQLVAMFGEGPGRE